MGSQQARRWICQPGDIQQFHGRPYEIDVGAQHQRSMCTKPTQARSLGEAKIIVEANHSRHRIVRCRPEGK